MSDDMRAYAESVVEEDLGERLSRADNPPGLREATVELTAADLAGDAGDLIRSQLDHLRGPSSKAVPDAYLGDQAAAEDALQHAAAGIRVALAQTGTLVDAIPFERAAKARLADDPTLAVRAELARVPRPVTRPEMLRWSLDPAPWASDRSDERWPPPGIQRVNRLTCLPGGVDAVARVAGGSHDGWAQIGILERHQTPATAYPQRHARRVVVALGLEITETDPPNDRLPFTHLPWQMWILPWQRFDPEANADHAVTYLQTGSFPAVGLTDGGHTDPDHVPTGLGVPPFVLAPILAVVVALGLEPTIGLCGFSLSDSDGSALVSRQWHGHLVHDGNYEPLIPAVEGTDLILRPDLFERLRGIIGDRRFRLGVSVTHSSDDDDM